MIRVEITAVRYELDDKMKDYIQAKIGKLDRYIPRHARESLQAQAVLTEEDGRSNNRFDCEVTIELPHETITAKDATINMYAAVDIVEAKIKSQVIKYKEKHLSSGRHIMRGRRMIKDLTSRGFWRKKD